MDNWSVGQDSFESDPPNAALVFVEGNLGEEDIIVGELLDPVYDKEKIIREYDIISLDLAAAKDEKASGENVIFSEVGRKGNLIASSDIPDNFGKVSLFIDSSRTYLIILYISLSKVC